MKMHTSLMAIATATMLAFPALAQTQTQTQPAQPGMTATTPAQQPMGQAGAMRPIAGPQPGQMLSSDLSGTTVYGMNNENIGEINDMLMDRDGRVTAVIIGVGGFLGIGEKDVAVPFETLEIVGNDRVGAAGTGMTGTGVTGTGVTGTGVTGTGAAGTRTGVTGTGVGTPTGTTATGTGATGTTATGTGTTGTGVAGTGTAGTGTGMGAGMGTGMGAGVNTNVQAQVGTVNPQRIMLRGMTRADLESAPAFRSDGSAGTTGSTVPARRP